jgi:VCBS repeat-containing protein
MPEDFEALRLRSERPRAELAQLPEDQKADGADAETAPAPSADDAVAEVGAPAGSSFVNMSIAELLQLDLILPQGAESSATEAVPEAGPDADELMELSLLELMDIKAVPAEPPELPDLNPPELDPRLPNDSLDQGPPSHLSPEGGLTPIGVLPGTDSIPPPPPPPPPPVPDVNVAPDARNDSYVVAEDGLLTKTSANGVLLNDIDANFDKLQVTLVSGPANGVLTLNASGAFTYDPNPDFFGKDTFTYQASDGQGGSDTATVTINVTSVNDAPTIVAGSTTATGSATERSDGAADENAVTHQATGTIAFADVDVSNTHSASFAPGAGGYLGSFVLGAVDQTADTVDWTFSVNDSVLDSLAAGQVRVQTYDVTINDKNGGTATQTVTITITGTNDAPTIVAGATTATGSATERTDKSAGENSALHVDTGTITFADVDVTDNKHAATVTEQSTGYLGALVLGALNQSANTVGWTFTVNDGDLDSLAAGQTLTQLYDVEIDDQNGGTVVQTITITLAGSNDAPTIVAGSTTATGAVAEEAEGSPDEGTKTHQASGTIAFDDVDAIDSHSAAWLPLDPGYLGTFTLGAVDPANKTVDWTFTVDDSAIESLAGGQILTQTYTITIDDGKGGAATQNVTVTITGANDVPTDIALSNAAVDENAAGAVIGSLTVTDPDAGDNHTFTVSDPRFEIASGKLQLKAGTSLDFEAEPTVSVDVTATDKGGLSRTETFVISVGDVNEAPTDLDLSAATVTENDAGAIVGALSVTDPDAGDSHAFAVDDARFEVDGSNQLRLKAGQILDFESEPTINVKVTVTDAGGLTYNETFIITVTNANEAPTDLKLSSATVAENDAGAIIGTLGVTDPDVGDSHTFAVDDPRFEVDGSNQLRLKAGQSLDFESEPTVNVKVTATDAGGLTYDETFVITVTDVNEAPTDLALSSATVAENDAGAIIGTLGVTDPDVGDSHTFAVDDPRFEVDGSNQLRLKAGQSLDFESEPTVNVKVTATDSGGLTYDETFVITVTDVIEPLFSANADTVDLNSVADGGYVAGTQYDALGGDDTVTLPADAAAASKAGYDESNTFNGGDGDDTVIGGGLNDLIAGGTGADSLSGGAGDDAFEWDPNDAVDGGSGIDTVVSDVGDVDLTTAGLIVLNIEQIDLGVGTGSNKLTLSAQDVVDVTAASTLTVLGDASDSVNAGTGWSFDGFIGGFDQYSHAGVGAILRIDPTIGVNPDILDP